MTTRDQDKLMALKIFSEPCMGKTDKYHGGNCTHCALRGLGAPNTDYSDHHEAPNYAGWPRLYIQAGKPIPSRFIAAFYAERGRTDNQLYTEAIEADIKKYGVIFESIDGTLSNEVAQ